jgi:hypothetical protein
MPIGRVGTLNGGTGATRKRTGRKAGCLADYKLRSPGVQFLVIATRPRRRVRLVTCATIGKPPSSRSNFRSR